MIQSTPLYPLRFEPLFRRYLWGGRRLGTLLGKPIGEGDDYAESWEIVDHGEDQSVVAAGPLAGATLHELVTERGQELFGQHHPQKQMPLLLKFLDAHKKLSVQVHPTDAMAAQLDPPDLGKTEAWVVLAAEPGSKLYAGLKPGVDREQLARHVEAGTSDECLHVIEPKSGDCIFLPAGVVHAIGGGLVIAEIQQSSDTTYRLFDWNRVDAEGNPRQLHIEEALDAINFDYGPAQAQVPQPTGEPHAERLVACDKFVMDRWTFDEPRTLACQDRCHLIAVLDGVVKIEGDPSLDPLSYGNSALLPAALGNVELRPTGETVLLDMYLP